MNKKSKKNSCGTQRPAMQIRNSSRLVSLPVNAEHIFHFPEGLPAFEDIKEFIFIYKPDTEPFVFMQALEPADISFVCIDPFLVCPEYQPRISEEDVGFLQLEKPDDVLMLGVVTVDSDIRNITMNLQGPIAINMQKNLGKQIICENHGYPVRYRIWDAVKRITAGTAQKHGEKQPETAVAANV